MKIRPAAHADARTVAEIHRSARAAAMPWLPVMHSVEEDLAFFRDRVLPVETVYVAETEEAIVGFLAFEKDWLNHLYVTPGAFRSGIGGHLLAKAKTSADQLQLWTFQGNTNARAFYAAHGFEGVEFTNGANNEEQTPDVRMIWRRA